MRVLTLRDDDVASIDEVVGEVCERYNSVESAELQRYMQVYAAELPRGLRAALNDFRLGENSAAMVISGLPVNDARLGPTPADWQNWPEPAPTLRQDVTFLLISALLGDPIGWATQQDGRMMHSVFPIKAHEDEQIGWGSKELLTWHTEDAFHPMRTDYLGLMCLRNPDEVETTLADIADVRLDAETAKILSEDRFHILPDNSHRAQNQIGSANDDDPRIAELRRRSQQQVENALAEPPSVPVLFGDPADPYLRIDPYYMQGQHQGVEQRALDAICAAIDAAMGGVVLEPGDIIFVDNFRAVHGRKPFQARFDGTDRWLRRLNITRDLRKSREFRLTPASRVIF
ncbi:MAG TPA: guanitoxin biosynthesis L-enduracididine beta-hydroxylase GntD [Pseudonocardiaceae bacterium]|jgi:Fe(II)/alpha-ketoglutarate-dependent arginine beta-hydroxylase